MNASKLMADAKFYESYSRFRDVDNRYETWDESVERVMGMHKIYYADKMSTELADVMTIVQSAYVKKMFLGSQRALQFGGEQLLKNHNKLYNCTSTYCDRVEVFGELSHLMLSGCGVGFSVQTQHIAKMPNLKQRGEDVVTFVVEDSIEGWATAVDVLMSSFFVNGGKHPEFHGKKVYFDLSKIRKKGSMISGGFKAPGPEGLRKSLDKIELLLIAHVKTSVIMTPIIAYDIVMHIADAVISGGVRRAASICLFSKEDEDMLNAKTGNWFIDNPQRGRSNNSVMLLRGSVTFKEFQHIMEKVKQFGEPGFIWTDDLDMLFNPCVEIGMYAYTEDGRSGFSMCNLTEINGGLSTSKEMFFEQCKVAAIMGTLQAGYTNFKFVSSATKEIVEREALLGVSITGWMNNPDILFDGEILEEGAKIVRYWNEKVAAMIGINAAARLTCVKPSGNASVLLGTASGIHGEHSKRYLRHVQFNRETEIAKLFLKENPDMCQDSVWGDTDIVVGFPITPKEGSIYKKDLLGTKQLDYVVKAQKHWVNTGTIHERCAQPYLNHNVSNTITVDNWDDVTEFIYDNRDSLCGVSLLPASGDKAYPQAPFTEVLTAEDILVKYGEDSFFASGLIEAGLTAFNGNLWNAIATAAGMGETLNDSSADLLKSDFVRRFEKFSKRFVLGDFTAIQRTGYRDLTNSLVTQLLVTTPIEVELEKLITARDVIVDLELDGDQDSLNAVIEDTKERINKHMTVVVSITNEIEKHVITIANAKAKDVCSDCLKDVYNLHKWNKIESNMRDLDWSKEIGEKVFTEVDTIAAEACSGGKCDI